MESAPVIRGAHAIGFHVFQAPQQLRVGIKCGSGSGGDYSLSLEQGRTYPLGGEILLPTGELTGVLVEAAHNDLGHTTEYYAFGGAGALTYLDMSRVPGSTTVAPFAAGYTFVPESQSLTLSSEVLDFDFDAIPGAIADGLEPNNTPETAAVLSLPYLAADALSVGPSDPDYLRFNVPDGEAFLDYGAASARRRGHKLIILYGPGQKMKSPWHPYFHTAIDYSSTLSIWAAVKTFIST